MRIFFASFSSWLLAVERAFVSIAAALAIFPIWQFVSESRDRELDRAANFISAYRACFGEDGILIEDKRLEELGSTLNAGLAAIAERRRSGELVTRDEISGLADRLQVEVERTSKTMVESCKRLDALYLATTQGKANTEAGLQ